MLKHDVEADANEPIHQEFSRPSHVSLFGNTAKFPAMLDTATEVNHMSTLINSGQAYWYMNLQIAHSEFDTLLVPWTENHLSSFKCCFLNIFSR